MPWFLLNFKSYFFFFLRIQSDHLAAMATFLEILIKRIEQLNDPKIRLVAVPLLPISVLLAHVDSHYNCYVKVQSIRV